MKYRIIFIAQLLCSGAMAASFDCEKAVTQVEKIICNDEEASRADEKFAQVYEKVYRSAIEEDKLELKSEQLHWLKNTRSKCDNAKCVVDAYARQKFQIYKYYVSPGKIRIKHNGINIDAHIDENSNGRNESFDAGMAKLGKKIIGCENLIYIQVPVRGGNTSFGAYCNVDDSGSNELVRICDDVMVGHFKVESISSFGSTEDLVRFTGANCYGG